MRCLITNFIKLKDAMEFKYQLPNSTFKYNILIRVNGCDFNYGNSLDTYQMFFTHFS